MSNGDILSTAFIRALNTDRALMSVCMTCSAVHSLPCTTRIELSSMNNKINIKRDRGDAKRELKIVMHRSIERVPRSVY